MCVLLVSSPACSHPNAVCAVFQIDQILGEEPEVKERLFAVLKQYAAEKKVDWLASVLPDILITDDQRQLISSIRYPAALALS